MKRSTSLFYFAILAFASLSSAASAQDLPVSRTAGVIDVSLPTNKASLVSIPLVNIVASGTITSVSGTTLGVSSNLTSSLSTAASPHAIKITSRDNQAGTSGYGQTGQISANATGAGTSTVTTTAALTPSVGDEFVIYQLETLSSLFGAPPAAGWNGAGSSASADLVYLDDAGTLSAYFYKNTTTFGGAGWRLASGGSVSQNNTVIRPNRGVYVQRRNAGSAFTLRSTGVTLPGNETASVVTGFSIINNPFTVPTTLAGSGLSGYVSGGAAATGADILYLETAGVLTGYFYKNTTTFGGVGWRLVSGGTTDQGAVALTPGKAILFQEKTAPLGFALPEPFAQ